MKDLVVIGSGPAALTAAIYAAREGIDTVVYEKEAMGGVTSSISEVENFPGFLNGISGMELTDSMKKQAEKFGAELEYGEVSSIKSDGDKKVVVVDGDEVEAKAVLIASGCERIKLGVPGEELAGVHYCATCDGALYKDKDIVVIGGSNSAVQEAIFLTKFAKHVTIVALFDIMACDLLQDRLEEFISSGKISVNTYAETKEVLGDKKVEGVLIQDRDGERRVEAEGVFVFVGMRPGTEFLKDSGIELSDKGFVVADENFETSMEGVFVAGDVREGSVKQAIVACGEGASAALSASKYIEGVCR